MRSRPSAWGWFALLLPVLVGAAPLERDLGQGLRYVRVRELPADLPAKSAAPACVVDVRYVPAGRDAAVAFAAWLEFRATVRTPVLVLANRETSLELRQALRVPHRGTGIAVIGIAGPDFEPDLAVRSTPEVERAAYDAVAQGTPLAVLLTDHPEKVRNDEARLARSPATFPVDDETAPGKTAVPLIDAALQRAVHLHRSRGAPAELKACLSAMTPCGRPR